MERSIAGWVIDMSISPARKAAFKILSVLERGEGHSDDLLRADAVNALSVTDRNLATALVMGVLRWRSVLDAQVRTRLAKPNAKLDVEIGVALRMGVYQLLYLDRVPAHAAIDESVELAKRAGHKFAAGMVNAVLRGIAGDREVKQSVGDATRFRIESRAAYPAWMVERWVRLFGADAAYGICAYGQEQPRLSVRLMDAGVEQELAAEGVRLEAGRILTAARTVVEGDVTATQAFRAGRVRVQDEGSQLVGEIAAAVVGLRRSSSEKHFRSRERVDEGSIFPGPAKARDTGHTSSVDGLRVLDACAAPGGKTLILADRLIGAQVVACEASPLRHAVLRARMAPYRDRVDCRLMDATALADEELFDLVLVDAPCSGTGTLGRNPEIRHRLHEEGLVRQAERQKAILRAALRAVKRNGHVVYSTCSLEPEENERVLMDAVDAAVPGGEILSLMRRNGILTEKGAQELMNCVTEDGTLRLLPGVLGTDGFFVAVLEKV